MKKIYTGYVVDPSIQQPFTTKSLDFLQNANKEMINVLCRTFIMQKGLSYNTSVPYYFAPTTMSFPCDGSIFFNNELYIMAENYAGLDYCMIDSTADAVADPLTFTDGFNRNVHQNRYLTFTSDVNDALFAVSAITTVSAAPVPVEQPKPVSAYNIYGNSGVQFGAITGFSQSLKCTSEIFDDDNLYNTSTGVYTCPEDGYYRVTGKCRFTMHETLTDGDILFYVYKNGSGYTTWEFERLYDGNYEIIYAEGDAIVKANAGDTIELYVVGGWTAPATAYVRTSNVIVLFEYLYQ
ncbi:MAG: C1q domain [Bacteroidetes bacterium]|jgi:hypothetical protein|nr:C1q domain [Bacteroidota bacterium]